MYFHRRETNKDAEKTTTADADAIERQATSQANTHSDGYLDLVELENPDNQPQDSELDDGVSYGPYCTIEV